MRINLASLVTGTVLAFGLTASVVPALADESSKANAYHT